MSTTTRDRKKTEEKSLAKGLKTVAKAVSRDDKKDLGGEFMVARVKQLLPDPNQPRKKFSQKQLESLAQSIKTEGLQQPIIITFAYMKDDIPYYYIKAGERRWKAHIHLGMEFAECLLRTSEKYSGIEDVERILAQAAENNNREPQTHSEIVAVVQKVVAEQEKASNGARGYISIAMKRVASAFGMGEVWAGNYHTLSNLHPDFLALLDEDDVMKERLNFQVGLALARAPQEVQKDLYEKAKPLFKKNFLAGLRLITDESRKVRKGRGERIRGRQSDEMDRLISLFVKMGKPYDAAFAHLAEGDSKEQHLKDLFAKMTPMQCDGVLLSIRVLREKVEKVYQIGEVQRGINYRAFREKL